MIGELLAKGVNAIKEFKIEQQRAGVLLNNIIECERLLAKSRAARIGSRRPTVLDNALFVAEMHTVESLLSYRYKRLPETRLDLEILPLPAQVVSVATSYIQVKAERRGIEPSWANEELMPSTN